MKATNWEFRNRALLFGLIFAFTFPLYSFDHQNATATLANWLGARLRIDADLLAHLLFALALSCWLWPRSSAPGPRRIFTLRWCMPPK